MYEKFFEKNQLDPAKFRAAWAFCMGNPWENSADSDSLNEPELIKLADELAQLVLDGTKTATASEFASYARENEPVPVVDGKFDIVLNSKGDPVCAVQTTKVYVTNFAEVSADHAYKEGENDRSLISWREVHEAFFRNAGVFSPEMEILCEEFEVIAKWKLNRFFGYKKFVKNQLFPNNKMKKFQ